MTGLAIGHLVTGAGLAGLGLHALVNHLTLPGLAGMSVPPRRPRMSVLIPARNEAQRIGSAVAGWARQDYPEYEVVVYDDDSSDDTADRARRATGDAVDLTVVRGGPLPAAWRGKPWACHQLRALATGEVLVFADADVIAAPDALARIAGALARLDLDALSALPAPAGGRPAVQALAGLQHWAALTFVPSWLGAARRRPVFAAITGQLLAVRTEAYDAAGGFAGAAASLAEDVALGRRLVAAGYRVRLLDGARVIRCQAYPDLRALWTANTRNLVPVFFDSATALLGALGLLGAVHLWPLAALIAGLAGRAQGWAWIAPPLLELVLGLVPRLLSDRRAGHPRWLALSHPLAVLALVAMGVDSAVRFRLRRRVEWRDRRYRLAA